MAYRRCVALILMAALALPAEFAAAQMAGPGESKQKSAKPMATEQRALHALNRLAFGPRPGDLERVRQMGVEKWIEAQLEPQKISDAALEARLAGFTTLQMDSRELLAAFPPPQVLRAVEEGRMPMPGDKTQRAVYEAQLEAYKARQQAEGDNPLSPGEMMPGDEPMTGERQGARAEQRAVAFQIMQLPAEQRLQAVLALPADQRRGLGRAMSPEQREEFYEGLSAKDRQALLSIILPPGAVVAAELQQAKLLRAIYSERQLEELMVDFWFNHFNVFAGKGPERYLLGSYERDVIRPRVFGQFKDLLAATAESPAMLFYLDNWQSVGPNSDAAKFGQRAREGNMPMRRRMRGNPQQQQQAASRIPSGLNENYARELLELHTLGVNGGYTQKDVTEVAKVFTGWALRQPRLGGGFNYNDRMHEPGDKVVLGQKIKSGGREEGRQVIEMLARHPATAKFISTKLAMRFVSDEPPAALVERMAATFTKTDGNIKEVLRTLFASPEFWSEDAYRAKVKTPLEFVASAVRATGAEVRNAVPLAQTLNRMGMPLYMQQPPTGYSMKAEAWVNSSALLNRMNFALGLAAGRLPGLQVQRAAWSDSQSEAPALSTVAKSLLGSDLSAATEASIRKRLGEPGNRALGNTVALAGLVLGSPEFQRR